MAPSCTDQYFACEVDQPARSLPLKKVVSTRGSRVEVAIPVKGNRAVNRPRAISVRIFIVNLSFQVLVILIVRRFRVQ